MDASETRAGPSADTAAATVGQTLRNARTARALSIDQLATELRIEAPQLAALERNEFERIGPPVFVKGYLRQYGQRLGLSYNDLLGMYYAQAEAREVVVQPSRTIKLRDERQITVWVIAAVVLVALGAALVVWWINNGRPMSFSRAADSAAGVQTAAVALPAEVGERATSADSAAANPAQRTAASGAERTAANPAELFAAAAAAAREPAERQDANASPLSAQAGEGVESPGAPTDAAQTATAGPSPAGALAVVLEFREESWAEVTAADGTRLFYGLGAPGRRAAFMGAAPIDVLLGNAAGVAVTVNGAPWPVPAGRANRAQFTLTARTTTED